MTKFIMASRPVKMAGEKKVDKKVFKLVEKWNQKLKRF